MDTKVTSIWNWDSVNAGEIDSHEAVLLFSSMTLAMNAGHSGMAGLVHRHGVIVQSEVPSEQLVARKVALKNEFEKAWDAEMQWIMSAEAGEKQLTKHDLRAMLAAVGKVATTIGFGGDLKKLDTASKCEKFNKEHNIAKKAANAAAELREEAIAMADVEGLELGTPEFDKFVKEYIAKNTPDNVKGGKSNEPVLSSMQVFGQKVSGLLSKLEDAGYDDKKLLDLMNHFELSINQRLDHLAKEAAIEAGLVDDGLSLDAAG